jgi:hypothetical protein
LSTSVTSAPIPIPPYTVSPSKSPGRSRFSIHSGRSPILLSGLIAAELPRFGGFPPLRRYIFAGNSFFNTPRLIARYIVFHDSLAPGRSIFKRSVTHSGDHRYLSPKYLRTYANSSGS